MNADSWDSRGEGACHVLDKAEAKKCVRACACVLCVRRICALCVSHGACF